MTGAGDRRNGYDDFVDALKAATKDLRHEITSGHNELRGEFRAGLEEHATEARNTANQIRSDVRVNSEQAKEVAAILKPLPERIARLESSVGDIKEQNNKQWQEITDAKDRARNAQSEAERAKNILENIPGSFTIGTQQGGLIAFWQGPTGRIFAICLLAAIIGFFGVLGVQVFGNKIAERIDGAAAETIDEVMSGGAQ